MKNTHKIPGWRTFILGLGFSIVFLGTYGQTQAEAPTVVLQKVKRGREVKIIEGQSRIEYRLMDGTKGRGAVSQIGENDMIIGNDTVRYDEISTVSGLRIPGNRFDYLAFRKEGFFSIFYLGLTGLVSLVFFLHTRHNYLEGIWYLVAYVLLMLLFSAPLILGLLIWAVICRFAKLKIPAKWKFANLDSAAKKR